MLMDQPLLKMMFYLSDVTGDGKYEVFATRYMDYYMKNLVDEKGFFWWGWHRWYQVYEEIWGKPDYHPHEIHQIHSIAWDRLWKVNPQAVENEITAIWERQVVDKKIGAVNRHNDERTPSLISVWPLRRLYRRFVLCIPRPGKVSGLTGQNFLRIITGRAGTSRQTVCLSILITFRYRPTDTLFTLRWPGCTAMRYSRVGNLPGTMRSGTTLLHI
jgi:hypothetical protein